MDGSATYESILVAMDDLKNDFLESIGKDFGDQLETTVKERDGSIIIDSLRGIFLRYQGDESIVETLQIEVARMKFITKLIKLGFDDRPTRF